MCRKYRILSLMLAVSLLFGIGVQPVQAANPDGLKYLNTYINTGNQRQDIIGVALTQLGYTEIEENDTKYGDWKGYPYQPWCASFVSWCARQANISTDILNPTARAHPDYFEIPYYSGKSYTPKPGDLFFTKEFTHVGLVYYIEGEFFYSLEGNAKYHDYTVPDDPEEDSYYVMTNKRRISDYYFGVPAYEGCDKDHTYVSGYDTSHPHKTYYKCTTCGDKYYTGYTKCLSSCSKCLSCGCSSSYAGYYLVSSSSEPVLLRSAHSAYSYVGHATVGEVVYVYGADKAAGLAYIEYDGLRAHIPLRYLTKYNAIPEAPKVTSPKTDYVRNDTVTVRWNTPANTEQFRLKVYRDGSLYAEKTMDLNTSYQLASLQKGEYEVQVIACNRSGVSSAGTLRFTVRDTYAVSYDARGGAGGPTEQSQVIGQPLTLSTSAPSRKGYTFLGWTDDSKGNFVVYGPGATLSSSSNIKLYAVWKKDDASLKTMTIERMPDRRVFLLGEALDTTGLALRLMYSDGSGYIVTKGFTAEGFDSESYGTKTVTVARGGLTVTYDTQVTPYIPGDFDLNKSVNRDDVMQLLWHISFPDRFTIETPADFNADGVVNRDDVMHLLWHISFPDRFPLEIVWPEEDAPTQPDPTEDNEESGSSEDEPEQTIAEGEST